MTYNLSQSFNPLISGADRATPIMSKPRKKKPFSFQSPH